MPEGVIATVSWNTKPDLTDSCIETLRDMFQVTRQRKGFRNIRLLRSAHDQHELVMIQEWDSVQDHQNYMQFRTETGDIEKLMGMIVGPMKLNYWMNSPLAAADA